MFLEIAVQPKKTFSYFGNIYFFCKKFILICILFFCLGENRAMCTIYDDTDSDTDNDDNNTISNEK